MGSPVEKISYKDAGVDVERGDDFVLRIKDRVKGTYGTEVMSGVGGFAALYRMNNGKILAAGTDGVGTKVKIAQLLDKHDTVGIDLVAMCVNDVICTGATPMFFLDYIATGALDLRIAEELVTGMVDGCHQAGMALIGGETAEMPGLYRDGEYDLAGFAVGEVSDEMLLDGSKIKAGDVLIALPSSGLHSNGFSLVRHLVGAEEKDLLEMCLTPTRIYCEAIRHVSEQVNGLAHITGGGFANIPRMNEGFDYVLDQLPGFNDISPVFLAMKQRSHLALVDLCKTFNMGIGMVVATSEPEVVLAKLEAAGEAPRVIGYVAHGKGDVRVSGYAGEKDFVIRG